jgi:hypothetical protein
MKHALPALVIAVSGCAGQPSLSSLFGIHPVGQGQSVPKSIFTQTAQECETVECRLVRVECLDEDGPLGGRPESRSAVRLHA